MNVFQNCSDTSDATPLSTSQGLYLKPVARLNISVQLPSLKTPGKTISNWEVMEKLRQYAAPEEFISLKVAKSTLEVVRFEGEIENRSKLPAVLARLDGRSLKLSGFHESLKVRAAEAKPDFPTRHSWDSYFRDAKNMNEMKPGERPDTIHITNLPCKWFAAKSDASKPSEYILRKVFDMFGEVRCVDIPMLDPFRSQMKSHISGIKMFSNNQNMIFEAYIQFKEYVCFVKAMDALRGMKLLRKDDDGKAFSASVKVDFDKTKHLSDSSIRRRRVERERLMAKERERENQERRAREEEERKLAAEKKRMEEEKAAKMERQRQREERRKAKMLERLKHHEADEMNKKIATEERLLLIAQRRLESFRLLGELFNRLKSAKERERDKNRDKYKKMPHQPRNQSLEKKTEKLQVKEKELREKLVKKFKHSDRIDEKKAKRGQDRHETESEPELSDIDQDTFNDHNMDNANRDFQRGRGRGGWFSRGRRRNMPFRGNQFPPMPFQTFPNRGGFFPQRGFPRWPRFPPGGRGGSGDPGFFPPPFIDPYYLESAMNDPYYKYFHKIALGNRHSHSQSRSRSRSYSRSYSRSRSSSRRRSRSSSRRRSRSSSRRRSQSSSRRRSRSRHRRTRSYSRSSRSQSRSRSRGRKRSKSRKRRTSHKSRSSRHSHAGDDKPKDVGASLIEENLNKEQDKSLEKLPSVHTWSKSPSPTRSLSWEKRNDEPTSSTKSQHKHKKEKKKEKRKKRKKDDK